MLKHFQSKALRMTVDTPRYVPNTVIRRDLQTPTVKEEIRHYSSQYSGRKLHNEVLRDLHFSTSIIRMIKLRRMRWAGHVARMGRRKAQ
jgi:hypothetical protein